jgi:hypothetical protein
MFTVGPCPFRGYISKSDRIRKEGFIVKKLQRGLSSIETWCERWNIKINEDKTQGIYFSRSRRPPESYLTLNGINIHFCK